MELYSNKNVRALITPEARLAKSKRMLPNELIFFSFLFFFYFILEKRKALRIFYFILFYFILFYFILFYFILFYFILFYFILFYFIYFIKF
jgi:hypothetical protein